jgi:cytochrome c biogenesis factor
MKVLRSVFFTGILIVYLIVFFIFGTVIPQHQTPEFYMKNYNVFVSNAISFFGLNDYSHSKFLIIPSLLFFSNLMFCSIFRIVRRIKNKSSMRPGPDIIHLGILILITGLFISSYGKIEEMFFLGKGERLDILSDYVLILDDFIIGKYENGKPEKIASEVTLKKNGKFLKSISIAVNKPLMIEKYAIYQQSYSSYQELIISDDSGQRYIVNQDREIKSLKNKTVFKGYDNGYVHFIVTGKNNPVESDFKIGEKIENFTIINISDMYISGLKVVYDPGAIVVLISFIIISTGLSIATIQKTGELKK